MDAVKPEWLNTRIEDDVKWLGGVGPTPCQIMFVLQNPIKFESEKGQPFASDASKILWNALLDMGLDPDTFYRTYAVKYTTYEGRTPTATDIKKCRENLQREIEYVNPRLIVPLGATAFQAVAGGGFKITSFLGVILPYEALPGTEIFPMWAPAYILRNPQFKPQFVKHLESVMQHVSGETIVTNRAAVDYTVVENMDQAIDTLCQIGDEWQDFVSLDSETRSMNWMAPHGYMRTLQLNWRQGSTAIFRFYPTGIAQDLNAEYPNCVPIHKFMPVFQKFLTQSKIPVGGHNIRYDGEWLLKYCVDIRPNTKYDTMLAEHLIDNTSLMGLDDLSLKYTSYGRYDGELNRWKKANKDRSTTSRATPMFQRKSCFPMPQPTS